MTNTSATGGYLVPESAAPLADDALDGILQVAVAGITGLPGALVRPRWQATPPQQPDAWTDWIALGVMGEEPDANPAILHKPGEDSGLGTDHMQRHVTVDVLVSCYGPNASGYAGMIRDGIVLSQNFGTLRDAGLSFISAGRAVLAPTLTNERWIRRVDLPLTFRRRIDRTYPIRNLLSAVGSIATDDGTNEQWSTP